MTPSKTRRVRVPVVARAEREHGLEQHGGGVDPARPAGLARRDPPAAPRLVDVAPGQRLELADAHPGRVEHEQRQPVAPRQQPDDGLDVLGSRRLDVPPLLARQLDRQLDRAPGSARRARGRGPSPARSRSCGSSASSAPLRGAPRRAPRRLARRSRRRAASPRRGRTRPSATRYVCSVPAATSTRDGLPAFGDLANRRRCARRPGDAGRGRASPRARPRPTRSRAMRLAPRRERAGVARRALAAADAIHHPVALRTARGRARRDPRASHAARSGRRADRPDTIAAIRVAVDELEVVARTDQRPRIAGERDDRKRAEDGVDRTALEAERAEVRPGEERAG